MTEAQAQEMIDSLLLLVAMAEQLVFLCQVIAVCVCVRVGQALSERILLSKNSKKVW